MKKIVVLNSGGFDSTLLLSDLSTSMDCEIHSLHFEYGQPNKDLDCRISEENARKLGAVHHLIHLPVFEWTNSKFYDKTSNEFDSQYLEMRNMVFISYALSLAQSIGATEIYAALLKGVYDDCNKKFISIVNELCNTVGITFKTPYSAYEKNELYILAKKLGIGREYEFISCDTPVNGKPCGNCWDCNSISEYMQLLNDNLPSKRFFSVGLDTHDKIFQELFKKNPISEARILLNNDCQLNCKHCYHNNNELIGDILSDAKIISFIKEAYTLGIRSIHYAGKEPLFNDRLFTITEQVRDLVPDMEFSLVTNGINVPKFAERLKKLGLCKICLSADDEFKEDDSTRIGNSNTFIKKAVTALSGEIPIEMSYDLTPENIHNTLKNLKFWFEEYGITSFYIRTLRNVGCAENFPLISVKDLCLLHNELKRCNLNVDIYLNLGACPYFYDVLMDKNDYSTELYCDIETVGLSGFFNITDNYRLYIEPYCCRYENQITLTADGYILGCAMECSVSDYNNTSAGNIRDLPLKELIDIGKEKSLKVNESNMTQNTIYFEKCSFNPIDIL